MIIQPLLCVRPALVARATARPVVAALRRARAATGCPPRSSPTTARCSRPVSGRGRARCCSTGPAAPTGSHILTAPVLADHHRQGRAVPPHAAQGFFAPNDYRFATIAEAQAALDDWVNEYNHDRPHQSLGDRPPVERFRLAGRRVNAETGEIDDDSDDRPDRAAPAGVSAGPTSVDTSAWPGSAIGSAPLRRGAGRSGRDRRAGPDLPPAVWSPLTCSAGPPGMTVRPGAPRRLQGRAVRRPARLIGMADANGSISFAGAMYRAGRMWARCQVTVTLAAGSVQLSVDGKVVRVHPARHDRPRSTAPSPPQAADPATAKARLED